MPKMTNLKSRVKSNNKNFLDFLSKCLKIDPSVRMSAKQALNHPFITGEDEIFEYNIPDSSKIDKVSKIRKQRRIKRNKNDN